MQRRATIIFFLIMLISPLMGWLLGVDVKLDENRRLANMPNSSLEDLYDPAFYKKVERYFNDHFVFRGWLIKTKSWVDYYVFDTSPLRHIYIGKDGWLYYGGELRDYLRNDCNTKEEMRLLARQLHELEKVIEASGRKFLFVVAPNKSTIYPEFVGFSQSIECGKSRYDFLLEALSEYPVENFLRLDTLLFKAKKEHQVYFKMDTHYNFNAANIVSRAILQHLAPLTWNELFPEIKMATGIKRRSDLEVMMALNLKETIDYPQTVSYPSVINEEELKPLENGYKRYRITAKPQSGQNLLPRTIIYRDSFMASPLKILKGSFERLDVYWTYNLLHPETIEDLRNSQIIIVEIVERELGNLKINAHEVETVLADQ